MAVVSWLAVEIGIEFAFLKCFPAPLLPPDLPPDPKVWGGIEWAE
jgi:hypothetical protein